MKNFFLSVMAIFMMSSLIFATPVYGGGKSKTKETTEKIRNNVNDEPRVDSFKVISEDSGEVAGRQFCKITVNYYFEGHFVSQQSYTGYTCPLYGEFNCRQWRVNAIDTIQFWVDHHGTMLPPGSDMTC